jgi:hypothetical protein
MKSSIRIFFSVLLLCFFSLSQAAPDSSFMKTSSDTDIVIGEKPSIKGNDPSQNTVNPPMEMVNQSSFGQAIALLGDRGISFKNSWIIAMGFERNPIDTGQINFAIITLDSNNQPQKNVLKTSREFRRSILAKPGALGENSVQTSVSQDERETVPARNRQDGRVYFMLNTTLKSLWVYPANLSRAFPEIDGQVIAGLSLLTLGGSLYGSYLFTQNRDLGYGRVEFMNFGGDLGGLYYPNLMGVFLENTTNENTSKLSAWMGMIGYPLGIYLGSKVQFARNDEYGNASIMTTMSKWGLLYGFLLPQYFNLRENDFLACATGLSIVLIPSGFFVGHTLVGDNHYSSGRSIFIMTTGIMGAATGALIPTLWDSEDEPKLYATTTLLGQIAGTYIGFNYMKNRSYNFGQGLFMAASAIVGGALAESPLLIAKVGMDNHQAYTVLGIAGAWGGLALGEYLSRSLFEKSTHDKRSSSSISFPGLCELPVLLLCQKYRPHVASASYDERAPLAAARVIDIRF